ncbi:membrane protein [Kutzneria sp. 744]|nr:membrane protein [Kutzneria sp. 744]
MTGSWLVANARTVFAVAVAAAPRDGRAVARRWTHRHAGLPGRCTDLAARRAVVLAAGARADGVHLSADRGRAFRAVGGASPTHAVRGVGSRQRCSTVDDRQALRERRPTAQLALVFAAALWLEPVRTSLLLGQINIVLLALVAFDLCRRRSSKWTGVGVGLAAAVKLTPLLFVVYLLFARRFREAAVATATFVATVVIGLLIVPEAAHYWLGGVFGDSTRVGPVLNWSNQSIHGMLARLLGEPESKLPWMLLGGAVAVAATFLAGVVDRRGDRVLAIGLAGMTACAVSPFSWEHHWVWFIPVIIALAARGLPWWIPGLVFLAGLAMPTQLPPVDFGHGMNTGFLAWDWLDGFGAFAVRNMYVWVLLALLVGIGMRYGRRRLAGSLRSAERVQPA